MTKAATPTAGREHGADADRNGRRVGPEPRPTEKPPGGTRAAPDQAVRALQADLSNPTPAGPADRRPKLSHRTDPHTKTTRRSRRASLNDKPRTPTERPWG
ncbi:hypothetical protein GCM10023321_04850 [Pseudonocardia eucalypti]|uniref:Uncharacterized protein n=1 Tax=Pseudonocardia eucalypti TaxID=648755 RepID=A0ABP9PG21_9PSEU